MDTFYIVINTPVINGFTETGRFLIGNDISAAIEILDLFQGLSLIKDETLLRMELISRDENGNEVILNSLACTLSEAGENVKIILRKTFTQINLL